MIDFLLIVLLIITVSFVLKMVSGLAVSHHGFGEQFSCSNITLSAVMYLRVLPLNKSLTDIQVASLVIQCSGLVQALVFSLD